MSRFYGSLCRCKKAEKIMKKFLKSPKSASGLKNRTSNRCRSTIRFPL